MRNSVLALAFVLAWISAGGAQQTTVNQVPIKRISWASGQRMYHEYCASCHGENGAGRGPAAAACTVKPADLTTLAAGNDGKFPYDHFYTVLQFGSLTTTTSHGSVDMPVWLPLFSSLDPGREAIAQQRMYNLARYVAALQAK